MNNNIIQIFRKVAALGFALFISIGLFAQNTTLSGIVVDENNQPLPGAGIVVSGTNTGVASDENGKFTISVKKGTHLTINCLGFRQQELNFVGQNNITIKMVPDNQMLDELVVVGYGTMKRSDLTGSVSSIASKDLNNFKTASISGALGGQLAGVQITQTDGAPGSGFVFNIRGVGTLNGDSSPLFIVDGFQVDDISWLSNSDIESIEVLKDASSSAIYGARAANGVVMISTKSGKVSKPVVTYNGSTTYRKIAKTLEVMSPYDFVKLQGEINSQYSSSYFNSGVDANGNPYKYTSLNDYIGMEGVDWQSETFRPTWSQNHEFSLTGGTDQTKYSANFSRYLEQGIFLNSGFNKTTGKFRINQKLTKNITLDASINYSHTSKKGAGTTADNGRFNMLALILRARPTGGLNMTNEELLTAAIDPELLETGESLAQVNPIMQAQSVTNTKIADMWSANGSLTWEIRKGLTFKTAGTYATTNARTDVFYQDGSKEAYRNGQKPYGQSQMGKDVRWDNYNNLTWKQRLGKHNYDVMVGQEVSFKSSEYVMGQAMDFPFDNLGNSNLGIGATPSKVESSYYDSALLSFFARANYNYDERYLLTATIRADGSTVFSAKNKWGYFPSFSAAWRVSQEKFMKDLDWISNLKLRAGWGTVGNDRISNYLSLDLYTPSKYGLGTQTITVLTPKQLKNSNLKWEGSATYNVGLDLGLFDNRISFTGEAFLKNTKDLLLAQSLAQVTGFSSQMQNIGKIQNKGIELTVLTTNIDKRHFLWQSSFNISFIKNSLKSLASGVNAMYTRSGFDSNFTAYDYVAMVGQSLGLIYGYEFDGIYQSSDFNVTPSGNMVLKEGVTNNPLYGTVVPGVVKYKDQDGNGIITTADRTVIGHALPKFYGGFTNTFTFYGVDLSIMLQYNYGNDIYNATRLFSTQSRMGRYNMLAEVADRWSPTNASNTVPKYNGYTVNDVYSRFVEDGSFLRLKNVTLGYSLPKKVAKQIHVSKLRIYGTAENLFCLNNYSGYDPEVSTAGSNPMTPGLDWGAYPRSRAFTMGLDIQF
jgi:TonB-linked SusC/RagA family outer membrane protein